VLMTSVVIILAVILAICLAQRFGCRFKSIPWPYFLEWFLHNPYMKIFCHPRRVINSLDLKKDLNILEIGCGGGRISLEMAKELEGSGRIVGIDLQRRMIDIFKRRIAKLGYRNLAPIHCDFYNYFPNNLFDRIVMVTSFGEIPKPDQALTKVRSILKNDGTLMITEVLPDPCYIKRSKLEELLAKAGFTVSGYQSNLVSYTLLARKEA
jgi:ubiquinone/menaquinone biosynthesis C-methylase UbiE